MIYFAVGPPRAFWASFKKRQISRFVAGVKGELKFKRGFKGKKLTHGKILRRTYKNFQV